MTVTAALEKARLRSLDRSEQYNQLREDVARERGAAVKAVISGEERDEKLPSKAVACRKHYYDQLAAYKGGSFAFQKALTKRGVALWLRVMKAQQQSGASPEKFIRAQFDWFHKTFGRAPAVEQLTTEAAVMRAGEFGGRKTNVVGNNIPANVSLADVFRESEKLVQDIMRAQDCSREAFYRDFIVPGIITLPEKFLQADPTYRKVVNGD